MRVCFFSDNLPPMRCGVGDYVSNLAKNISKDNEIYFATFTKRSNEKNVFVLRKNNYVKELINHVKKSDIDLVHFHIAYSITKNPILNLSYFRSVKILMKLGIKVVVTFHQFPNKDISRGLAYSINKNFSIKLINKVRYFVDYYFGKLYSRGIKYVDYVYVVDPKYIELISGVRNKAKISVLPVPSNIEKAKYTEEEMKIFKEKIGFKSTKDYISFFGMLYQEKGFEDILEIIRKTDYHLLYIGSLKFDNLYRKSLEKLINEYHIKDKIISTDYLTQNEVGMALQLGVASIFPFINGYSSKNGSVNAALTQGVFTITTTLDKNELGYDKRKNICFVEPHDVNSMIDAIQKYREIRITPKRGNLTSWEDVASRHVAIYRELLEEK
ncbi:glycosyltransferase [Sporolactobacillus putidus]|uniref:Glycosyl transferase n=1 Tax=Sporolactobacillus putidus TaxID=492735 RepID=A0A917W394_9BACL|nr:hypothetical protein [Sporolactobacillus putidus]GGL57253.1 glycosyl transferase [Sporolactobacillus putidus]